MALAPGVEVATEMARQLSLELPLPLAEAHLRQARIYEWLQPEPISDDLRSDSGALERRAAKVREKGCAAQPVFCSAGRLGNAALVERHIRGGLEALLAVPVSLTMSHK